MKQRDIKIDIYRHLAAKLRDEVLHCELVEESDLLKAKTEQDRLAGELERRADKLASNH